MRLPAVSAAKSSIQSTVTPSVERASLTRLGVSRMSDEAFLAEVVERVEDLETRHDEKDDRIEELVETVEEQEARINQLESWKTAARRKLQRLGDATAELQMRELEKGAHLQEENVQPVDLKTSTEHVERITKDDGETYVRIPGNEDPVDDSTEVAVAMEDLLPIQRLARLPEEMRESELSGKKNVQRAVWLWENRETQMNKGSGEVDFYIDAGELAKDLSIKFDIDATSETAKRVMEFFCEYSKHRAFTKKKKRPRGYEERRLILPSDASVPGDTGLGGGNDVVS